eukprot:SAG11_NODE_1431_length_4937_cov_1.954940_3_plen_120_part_00
MTWTASASCWEWRSTKATLSSTSGSSEPFSDSALYTTFAVRCSAVHSQFRPGQNQVCSDKRVHEFSLLKFGVAVALSEALYGFVRVAEGTPSVACIMIINHRKVKLKRSIRIFGFRPAV